MILPLGPESKVQELALVEKLLDGEISVRRLLPVRFVPVTGDH
jgi:protein-L-isoaspartate(D-aspartate) O-methyltransferase